MSDVVTKEMSVLKDKLDITDAEARVIIPVYLSGNVTAGGVSLLTGEKLTSVKNALGRLVKKGLVREIEGRVPVYQAVSPVLGLGDALSGPLDTIKGLSEETERAITDRSKATEAAVEVILASRAETTEKIRAALNSYEEKILALVQTQIENVVSVTSSAMNAMSDEMERSLEGLDSTMEQHLGAKLAELQTALDKGQATLAKDLSGINRSFDRWLKTERKTALASADEFEKRSKSLVDGAKTAVTKALTESSKALQELATEVSQTLTSLASGASDEGLEILNDISSELTEFITQLDAELGESYVAGQASLDEVIKQAREVSTEYGEFAKTRINAATEIAGNIGGLVDSWKDEVGGFMDVASQSVTSQLEQVAQTDANYLETMKNSLTSHIEKVNGMISDEYQEIAGLSTRLGADCEASLVDTRAKILELLQKQHDNEQEACEAATATLHSELDGWVDESVASIGKVLTGTARDVGKILDIEAGEMNSMTESMSSRLSSAFDTVIKSTQTKNEALLTAVKKASHDFEGSVGARLDEIISSFSGATEKQVKDSKVLYESLRDRLDKRMAKSVTNITSQSSRIQQEIDKTILEQVERIDKHAQGIRDEFHTHLQDMTKQFITLTQGLEATFNGLVSSQTVEARDLIASAHSEFKTSLKTEMTILKDESAKLQQEYSTDLAMKIDEVAATVAAGKRMLDELALDKRHEISESMAKTLDDLETAVRGTEQRLSDMESGTVKQFIENLTQISQEFNETLAGARDSISEKLENATAGVETTLRKSATNAKTTADNFVAAQKDLKQRFLADSSKKINRLATKRVKTHSEQIEKFRTELSESETGGVKARNAAKGEIITAVEARRSEVVKAFDSAAVWVDSTVSNVATSLDQFGSKLKNEVTVMHRGLQKAANEAAMAIADRGDSDMEKLQDTATALTQNTEAIVKTRLDEFADKCAASLSKGSTNLTSMPTRITEEVDNIQAGITEKTDEKYSTVANDLSTAFTECQRGAESATEEFKTLLERASISITEKRDEATKEAENSVVFANQHASRKLESIGLELKTQLSTESSRLVENARSEFAAKNIEITDVVTKTRNTVSEESSVLQQRRNDNLSTFTETAEKTIRRWSAEQKTQIDALQKRIVTSLGEVTAATGDTIDIISSINEAAENLLTAPSKRTWYLTGDEEAHAHILDMAERAESSVIISYPTMTPLDLKKLARVKAAKRRILILPYTEEHEEIEGLDGWRIWWTKTPALMALIDEKELLVGGSTDSEMPLAIISEEESYLKFYHDILGPRLIAGRVKE